MDNDFEDQLDKIRVDIYERTKNMSNKEIVRLINDSAKKLPKSKAYE